MPKKKAETSGAKPSNAGRISAFVGFLGVLAAAILSWSTIVDLFFPREITVRVGRVINDKQTVTVPLTNEGKRTVTIENVTMTVLVNGKSTRGPAVFASPSALEPDKGAEVSVIAKSGDRQVPFPSGEAGECTLAFHFELASGKRKTTLDTSCSCAAVSATLDPAVGRKVLTFFAYDGVATPADFEKVPGTVRERVLVETRGLIPLDLRDERRDDRLPPIPQREGLWTDTASLFLAGGRLTGSVLRNEIFLGSLGKPLPDPLFLHVPASAFDFARQQDALSAVTLYAVAMDRLERGDRSPTTRELFARARTMALGAQSRDDDSSKILEAIDKQLEALQ